MNCLIMVERSWLGNKLSMVVQGRSLYARLSFFYFQILILDKITLINMEL